MVNTLLTPSYWRQLLWWLLYQSGLPMTVAISLGFLAATMLEQQLLVRNNSGNENMGYVTDILSNKTGTFTKNQMTCAAGWFADLYYSQTDGVPNERRSSTSIFSNVKGKHRAKFVRNRVLHTKGKERIEIVRKQRHCFPRKNDRG